MCVFCHVALPANRKWLKIPVKTTACNQETSSNCLRQASFSSFSWSRGLLQMPTTISPLLAFPLATITNFWQACHQDFFYSIYALHIQTIPLWTSPPAFFFPACFLSLCPSIVALQSCKLFHHAPAIPAMSQLCDCTDFLFFFYSVAHLFVEENFRWYQSPWFLAVRDVPSSDTSVCAPFSSHIPAGFGLPTQQT